MKLICIMLLTIFSLSLIGAVSIEDVEDYWKEKGLSNETIDTITSGESTPTLEEDIKEVTDPQEMINITLRDQQTDLDNDAQATLFMAILFMMVLASVFFVIYLVFPKGGRM